MYYQHDPEHLAACTINVHALLHIADSIEAVGPVWAYWAFPMERYCGRLQRTLRSPRYPWSNLNLSVIATARLDQIKLRYNLAHELSLRPPPNDYVRGQFNATCVLLPRCLPSSATTPAHLSKINIHLQTRYSARHSTIKRYLTRDAVQQYARVHILPDGDEICASCIAPHSEDRREASYVKYDLLIDIHRRNHRRSPVFVPKSFYGELQNIFLVRLPASARAALDCSDDRGDADAPVVLILAGILQCETVPVPPLKNPVFSVMGAYEVVDITSVQCLVGRTKSPVGSGSKPWAIIDRSAAINHSYYIPDM
ncbi:hypothetical protein K525DRAFT_197963 [Schizophyllum commune Loenen D]|nr:hypothetical protein K525DRAFT_197963 [Schizophyllum commune Loenen D]